MNQSLGVRNEPEQTGCRKERIQETEVLTARLESQLGWMVTEC